MRTSTWTRDGAADALKILIDQNAQDFGLRLARHVGDLVEIERAAMGLFERADPGGRDRRPASTPNSSLSIRSGVIVGALMTTNGPSARAEHSMDEPRGQFLAGARRAGNEDARIGGAQLAR